MVGGWGGGIGKGGMGGGGGGKREHTIYGGNESKIESGSSISKYYR